MTGKPPLIPALLWRYCTCCLSGRPATGVGTAAARFQMTGKLLRSLRAGFVHYSDIERQSRPVRLAFLAALYLLSARRSATGVVTAAARFQMTGKLLRSLRAGFVHYSDIARPVRLAALATLYLLSARRSATGVGTAAARFQVTGKLLLIPALLLLWPTLAVAQDNPDTTVRPTGDALWYYQLGGGESVLNFSDGVDVTRIPLLQGDARWQLSTCNFDFSKSLKNYLGDFDRNLYHLEQNVLSSASALLRGSALSVLQRANPGLYDLITRSLVSAKADFAVAVKNCEQIQQDFARQQNPLHGWLKAALYADWEYQTGDGRRPAEKPDPVEVAQQVTTVPGQRGIPWVEGKRAGGNGQPAIDVGGDVIAAGYRLWRGDGSKPVSGRLQSIWPEPGDASIWIGEVAGVTRIQFCSGCEPLLTSPGAGLQKELYLGRQRATAIIDRLVNSNARPDAESLGELNSSGMGVAVTANVIQALRSQSPANRSILSSRLAGDIALGTAVEKILIARQLLRAGRRDVNVAANSEAQREIQRILDLLEEEIDNLEFEQRVRREILSDTAETILLRQYDTAVPNPVEQGSPPLNSDGGLIQPPSN